jgi:hypothetical protein
VDDTGELGESASFPPLGSTLAVYSIGSDWQTLAISLEQEMGRQVPGIDPDAVCQITIMLAVAGEEACIPDGCAAFLDVTRLSLVDRSVE